MDTCREASGNARVGSPVHWHFRAMPPTVQQGVIRRLALSGLREEDIAARTGWPIEGVRRAMLEDECVTQLERLSRGDSRTFRVTWNGSFAI